jgi:DNA-binding beta-propeller fold protein YncE
MRAIVVGLLLTLVACGSDGGGAAPADAGVSPDLSEYNVPPKSCAFTCPTSATCAEATAAYECPSLAPWSDLPHETTCPAWDGTYPAATPTACTVSAPSGAAVKYAGADPTDPGATILPDGRRIRAAGAEWLFDEKDLVAGMPMGVVAIPQTSLLVVLDPGYGPHVVRIVDSAKIGAGNPVTSFVRFNGPETLNAGAVFVAPDLVLLSTSNGVVQALKLDTKTGIATRDDARNIALPPSHDDTGKAASYYVGGIAVSPDAKRLVVTSMIDTRALVFDLSEATYGAPLGALDLGSGVSFACAFDPNDPTGHFAYATLGAKRLIAEIDVTAAPKLTRTFTTDKNPQALAFFDARWMAAANDFGDTISIIDRVAGTSTPLPVDVDGALHGYEPTSLAYDAANKRLYASLAGLNAVGAWSVDLAPSPPKITPAGRIPTSWWPSDVAVLEGGALAITTMRGHGNGPLLSPFAVGDGDAMNGVRGGVQRVPLPSAGDLAAWETEVKTNFDVGARPGAPAVSCPNGENDFPVPPTNTAGPSKKIDHVFFVVRENKTFDAVLGDLPGAEGSPALTMKRASADMDKVWPNFRNLARTFATSDNYYTSAELSIQGHTWTTYGRSSDYTERTWPITSYSRDVYRSQVQPQGVADYGQPEEGSLFDWMIGNGVPTDILGEAEGLPRVTFPGRSALDTRYPGGFIQSMAYPDVEKSCYVATRARIRCDIGKFVYMTLPNDHTAGTSAAEPSPELMVAVNDEATGLLVEAISHSPLWASSLIVVTEDDPANGGDHIDHHRTPVLIVSPWVKRGYVSKTHMDVSSLHKLFAHVYGIPYPNAIVAGAALPLDLFSSKPDFSPFERTPRVWPLSCGEQATLAEQSLQASWDFAEVDEQPGLEAQVWRWMRGEQLQKLTPRMEASIARSKLQGDAER